MRRKKVKLAAIQNLFKSLNVFAQISKCSGKNHKMYWYKSQSVFFQQDLKRMMRRGGRQNQPQVRPLGARLSTLVSLSQSPGDFPTTLTPDLLCIAERFRGYARLSDQTIFSEIFSFPAMNGGGGSVEDSLRGIREFETCLSAGVWVEVFAQVSTSIKMYLSQSQICIYSLALCLNKWQN